MPLRDDDQPTKEQLARLPGWAQTHISKLQREAATLREHNDTLLAAVGEAPLESSGLVTWSVTGRAYALPDLANVRFGEPGGECVTVGFRKNDLAKGELILWVQGSKSLVLQLATGNALAVVVRPYGDE